MSTEFARSVVKTCLRVKKGDKVIIDTWQHTLDLAEALTLECMRAGAFTHTTLLTDEIYYDILLNSSLDYLKATDPFGLGLLDLATAYIFISGPENPERMKTVPAERWDAMFKGFKPFYDKSLEKKVPSMYIMLGNVTPQRAKTYGFNYSDWKRSVDAALTVKYEDMAELGKKVGDALEKTREVHIVAGEGTDLRFRLSDRPVRVYDGVIDKEDLAKGLFSAMLPSGTVTVAPVEETVNGTFVADIPQPQYGKLIHDTSWGFKNGRLVSFTGGTNVGAIKETWEKASGDNDKLGSFSLGINPKARTGFLTNSIVLGTASISVGENRELGGKNESDWMFETTVSKPTVKLDGKVILKNGKFTI